MTDQKPPAGYYPDLNGAMRWWDGNQWTEHVQPVPPPAPVAAAAAGAERSWFQKKRYVIPGALVALMIVGSALGGGSEEDVAVAADSEEVAAAEPADDEAAPEKKKEEAKPKKKKAPVVKVSAAEMIKEFEDNELAGDKKYKGKRVQVTGFVSKIDTEFFDDDQYVLRMNGGDEWAFLDVNCNDMSSDELSTLTVGEEVTAVGKFDDGGDLGVELAKCKLA